MSNMSHVDVGFATDREAWMLEFHDGKGAQAGLLLGREITLKNCSSLQVSWRDPGQLPNGQFNPTDFWHVRARILYEFVDRIELDRTGVLLVECRRATEPPVEQPAPFPEGAVALEMAYSLSSSKGFVDVVDEHRKVLSTLKGRWLMTENLNMRTIGTYPGIRFRAEAKDVLGMVITGTTCTVVGR